MKIGCIGNMNNNMFTIVRLLRDRGLDAHLLMLDTEQDHFHPAADTFDLGFQQFTSQLPWGNYANYLAVDEAKVTADLEPYDILIGCGTSPAFAGKAGRKLDMFIPYGDDVYDLPYPKLVNPRWQIPRLAFSKAQREGIRAARFMHMEFTNEASERLIARTGRTGPRLMFGLPLVYTPLYGPSTLPAYFDRSHWHHEFRRIRDSHTLVVFHQARHYWFEGQLDADDLTSINYKGNDRLIRGFAEFRRRRPEVAAALVTLEYGPSVSRSRDLIARLGLESNVFWFPRMSRKDLMVGLSFADFGTGEFGVSFLSCGTVYESLAMGKPLLHHRVDALYEGKAESLYPLVNVACETDIADGLVAWTEAPEKFAAVGEAGRRWLESNVTERAIDQYVKLLGLS